MWDCALYIKRVMVLYLCMLAAIDCEADEIMKTSLQRLERSGISQDSLEEILEKKGFDSTQYTMSENTITSGNLKIIQFVNKLKAFKNRTESMPFFLIQVKLEDGRIVPCITIDPWKFKKDIEWKDDIIELSPHEHNLISDCEVSDTDNECLKLDREQIREKYFKEDGGLNIGKYASLSKDKNFIYCLIQKGYYACINDEAGYLFIE